MGLRKRRRRKFSRAKYLLSDCITSIFALLLI
jgi:hypothetical protein